MSRSLALAPVLVIAAACLGAEPSGDPQGPGTPTTRPSLLAGAAVVDTTPIEFPVFINGGFLQVEANQVSDPLHARCLVLDDGKTRLALCIVDSCFLPRGLLDEAKADASRATGIPADRMLIAATHAHSCPAVAGALGTDVDPHYPPLLKRKLIEVITLANQNLAPAQVAWGVVNAADYTAARRWIRRPDRMLRDPFGQISMRANMHPGFLSTDAIGPSGPIDPDLTVLAVRSADGRPVALLANFAMHYFATGVKPVSSDYFGIFCQDVARLLNAATVKEGQAPFVAMMSQGTSGDMWRVDYSKPKPKKDITIDEYAGALARLAVGAVANANYRSDVDLAMVEKEIRVKARLADADRLEWAKKIVAEMGARRPKDQTEVLAREAVFLSQQPEADLKLQAIRIGDFGITALPNEVYALTGLKIKAQSPLAGTMNIELANDRLGYIPPPEQHKLGGYTTWPARSSYCAVDTEPRFVETVVGLLEQVSGKARKPLVVPQGPFADEIRKAKPAAFWRLGEMAGGNAFDASGNSHDAAYEDGVVFFLEGPQSPAFCGPGFVHRAAHFCGGRVKADVPAVASPKAGYSVEMWFWNGLANEARPIAGYLFSHGPDGDKDAHGDHVGIGGAADGADIKGRLIFSNGAGPFLVGRTVIEPRTWNHIVLVREGRRVTVYLNGGGEPEIIGDADVTCPPNTSQMFIGGRNDKVYGLEGKIDEVAVFDRALPRDEVVRHFRSAGVEVNPPATQPAVSSSIKPTPPTPPQESVAKLHLKVGFEAELVASEPLVIDPIAIAFGPDGKLWVIEMTEYPLGKTGRMDPSGRIVCLQSTQGDGRYDKASVFAEGLNFPNGIIPWRKGVIVTAAPDVLYLEDTTGNGRADKKQLLYTGFTEANPQLRVNCPTFGLDNWLYLANGLGSRGMARSIKTGTEVNTSGHDIRIRPDEGHIEAETGVSQYGRRMDDWGTWLGADNSHPVRQFVIPERYAKRNPAVQLPRGFDEAGLPANPKVYPVSRGTKRYGYAFYAQSGHFTSACSIMPYRDDLLFGPGPAANGVDHVFICEPAHNLVQHLLLKPSGTAFTAEREQDEAFDDFLASEDDWCRPVFLAGGPDGALWMVDMYRFFIDHPDFLPPDGREDMRPYYRLGEDKGRIYRIYPKGTTPRPIPRLDNLSTPQLVAALESSSGWQRDMVRMMLVWRDDASAAEPLEHLAAGSPNALTRMHALCALDGIGKLRTETIEAALGDPSPPVRRQAVRLAEARAKDAPQLIDAACRLADDPDPGVRLQLAFTLGEWESPAAGRALARIAMDAGDDAYLAAAVLSSAGRHYEAIADGLIAANKAGSVTRDLLAMALARGNRDLAARLLAPMLTPRDGTFAPEQMESFAQFAESLAQQHTTLAKLAGPVSDALAERLSGTVALFEAARQVAGSGERPARERIAAIGLLGRQADKAAADFKLLTSLLSPGTEAPVQAAAVRAMSRFDLPEVPAVLTGGWKDRPAEVRAAALDVLISRETWAFELLKRVEAGELPAADIDPARRPRLTGHSSKRVRELAEKTIGAASGLNRTRVVQQYRDVYDLAGDASRGAKVFAQNCATCHHLGDIGQEIGPNLQSVAGWKADALLTAILDPSLSAEPRYLSYNCTLDTGEVAYGLLVRESAAGVTMKGLDARERTIPHRQVKTLECTNRSLMPDGLESAIDKQAMADLIKFLQSQQAGEGN